MPHGECCIFAVLVSRSDLQGVFVWLAKEMGRMRRMGIMGGRWNLIILMIPISPIPPSGLAMGL